MPVLVGRAVKVFPEPLELSPAVGQFPPATTGVTAGISTLAFTSILDALSQQGHVNVISKPRVSTLNNQRAIIKAATDDVYFEITISTSTGGPPIITATPRVVTIGVVLDVTPQIDAEGNILLDIQPSVTEETYRVGPSRLGFQGQHLSSRRPRWYRCAKPKR